LRDEPDDAVLEEELRQIIEVLDPVPEHLLAAAKDCYTWRTVDSDLAELVFDSVAEDHGVLVRGADQARLLSFEATGLTVDVQVTGIGQARRIIGQLAPPQRATVRIRQGSDGSDVTYLEADELGRFSGPLREGPFSLACTGTAAGSRPVITDWIAL
jgi:hypothetical protein